MHISLKTEYVWRVDEVDDPILFLKSLRSIVKRNDYLVIGSNVQNKHERSWLEKNCIQLDQENKPYSCVFDANRDEFPQGRDFVLTCEDGIFQDLEKLISQGITKSIYDIFIDDIIVYRDCGVILPLINFHIAFRGGCIELSGMYSEAQVLIFATLLNSSYEYVNR